MMPSIRSLLSTPLFCRSLACLLLILTCHAHAEPPQTLSPSETTDSSIAQSTGLDTTPPDSTSEQPTTQLDTGAPTGDAIPEFKTEPPSSEAASTALDLRPHKAEYTAKIKKGLSINGTAIRELKQSSGNQSWSYRFDVDSSIADIRESSQLEWSDSFLRPKQYRYGLSGFFIRNRKQEIDFTDDGTVATGKDRKRDWKLELNGPVLDRLSYQLQLAYDIASGKTEVHYQVVHKGKIEQSHFKVVRKETIDTVLGPQPSIVVTKVRAPNKKRETFIWLSEEYPLLLLKMTQLEKDGEFYEINLSKLMEY